MTYQFNASLEFLSSLPFVKEFGSASKFFTIMPFLPAEISAALVDQDLCLLQTWKIAQVAGSLSPRIIVSLLTGHSVLSTFQR